MGLVRLAEAEWLQVSPDLDMRRDAFDCHPESVAVLPEAEAVASELAGMLGVAGGLEQAFATFRPLGVERAAIPLVVAGGIRDHAQVRSLLAAGAAAVQLGTAFAVCQEGDAHPEFKRVLAGARPEDIVTFMSVAGLPARAVLTLWLRHYLGREKALQSHAKADPRRCVPGLGCLTVCGLRDGLAAAGQFCIATRLGDALRGDLKKGLFFRGSEPLPFGAAIRPVAELLDYLLTGRIPAQV
jgi:nitronate monooxygenase